MTSAPPSSRGVVPFFALACGITWLSTIPVALAWLHHQVPPPYAVALAGLSAFGPLLAALAVSWRDGTRREVFGRWRTSPVWIVAGLLMPVAAHLVATALTVVLGGRTTPWLHPPVTPENWAAAVVFPLGEEFGWRGFAQPRLIERFGSVKGALLVGVMWAVWHLAYSVTPEGDISPGIFVLTAIDVILYSLPIAWLMDRERGNGSMAVAIAVHAGAHLDHLEREPLTDLRIHGLHFAVAAVLAVAAGWALSRPKR